MFLVLKVLNLLVTLPQPHLELVLLVYNLGKKKQQQTKATNLTYPFAP